MEQNQSRYEPPKMKVYRFSDEEKALTDSGMLSGNYAANDLNDFMGGINTTLEKKQ